MTHIVIEEKIQKFDYKRSDSSATIEFNKSGFVEKSNLLVLNKLERLLTVCKVKNIDDIDFRCFKPKENYTRNELLA